MKDLNNTKTIGLYHLGSLVVFDKIFTYIKRFHDLNSGQIWNQTLIHDPNSKLESYSDPTMYYYMMI